MGKKNKARRDSSSSSSEASNDFEEEVVQRKSSRPRKPTKTYTPDLLPQSKTTYRQDVKKAKMSEVEEATPINAEIQNSLDSLSKYVGDMHLLFARLLKALNAQAYEYEGLKKHVIAEHDIGATETITKDAIDALKTDYLQKFNGIILQYEELYHQSRIYAKESVPVAIKNIENYFKSKKKTISNARQKIQEGKQTIVDKDYEITRLYALLEAKEIELGEKNKEIEDLRACLNSGQINNGAHVQDGIFDPTDILIPTSFFEKLEEEVKNLIPSESNLQASSSKVEKDVNAQTNLLHEKAELEIQLQAEKQKYTNLSTLISKMRSDTNSFFPVASADLRVIIEDLTGILKQNHDQATMVMLNDILIKITALHSKFEHILKKLAEAKERRQQNGAQSSAAAAATPISTAIPILHAFPTYTSLLNFKPVNLTQIVENGSAPAAPSSSSAYKNGI